MEFNSVQPDLIRFEMRQVQGQNPNDREQKKPGVFGRFLSGMGKVLGAMALPLSFIFPPAAIGAAGMYGLGTIGDQLAAKSYRKAAENAGRQQGQNIVCPGLSTGGLQPAGFDLSSRDSEVMAVLDRRSVGLSAMAQKI